MSESEKQRFEKAAVALGYDIAPGYRVPYNRTSTNKAYELWKSAQWVCNLPDPIREVVYASEVLALAGRAWVGDRSNKAQLSEASEELTDRALSLFDWIHGNDTGEGR